MKKVLIALDYDPTAQIIAEIGYSFAKDMNAQVTLLHVISNEVYYATRAYSPIMGFTGFVTADAIETAHPEFLRQAARNYLEKTKNHLGNASVDTLIEEGDFAKVILEAAESINADIIVLGSHSRRWLEKIVMGSVTEEVIRNSKRPLLIIPTRKDEQKEDE